MPALMTPCDAQGNLRHDDLVATARQLIDSGMSAVIYCGSMGDWPLLSDTQRQEGVRRLTDAGIPVIVGTVPRTLGRLPSMPPMRQKSARQG